MKRALLLLIALSCFARDADRRPDNDVQALPIRGWIEYVDSLPAKPDTSQALAMQKAFMTGYIRGAQDLLRVVKRKASL